LGVQREAANAARWPRFPGGFHEAWFVCASDPRTGHGLWLRYTVDSTRQVVSGGLWAAWFDRERPDRTLALRNILEPAAIGRGAVEGPGEAGERAVRIGSARLDASACNGEVEAGGHALRWRLSFGRGASPEDAVPRWLAPISWMRGSGYLIAHPAMRATGAVEVDGRILDLSEIPAMQGHLWGRSRWPAWAWARCAAFAEDPGASIDLLDVRGPFGLRFPMLTFRFRGAVHRFGELPWMPLTDSRPAAPSWHFAAHDVSLAIDGVARAAPEQMVQVPYDEPDGPPLLCVHSALASMEVRVRSRAFPGAPWRSEATLTARSAASLEFCGRDRDDRVPRVVLSAPAPARIQQDAGSVAS